jgi:hypothetical protein
MLPQIAAYLDMKEIEVLGRVNKAFALQVEPCRKIHRKAATLQRFWAFWRWCRNFAGTKTLAKEFAKANLAEADIMQNFAHLNLHVRESKTVDLTRQILSRIMHKAGLDDDIITDTDVDKTKYKKKIIRMFLASYPGLVMHFPQNVFSNFNVRERAVFEASRPLLASFRAIVDGRRDVTRQACTEFGVLLKAYNEAFLEWERQDKVKMTNIIKNATRSLIHARLTEENVEQLAVITAEIQAYFGRLEKYAGQVCCVFLS